MQNRKSRLLISEVGDKRSEEAVNEQIWDKFAGQIENIGERIFRNVVALHRA